MKNYLIIVNPVSGKRSNHYKIEQLLQLFESSNHTFEILNTTDAKRADRMIKDRLTPSHTHVIIAGGDGSVNEAINGLDHFGRPFGILPLGSGNDFVKNLPGSSGLEYLLSDNYVEVNIGKCNNRLFLNGVGAGFDGQIILNMLKQKTLFKGHAAYYYHVIKILSSFRERSIKYSLDGKTYQDKVLIILAANGTTFGGGFCLAPQADINDGLLDICIIKEISPLKRFLSLNRLKKGDHLGMKEVKYTKVKKLKIEKAEIHGQVDGEYFGQPPYTISLLPEKLKIIVP